MPVAMLALSDDGGAVDQDTKKKSEDLVAKELEGQTGKSQECLMMTEKRLFNNVAAMTLHSDG
jgi:hypothetical protein